MLSKKLWCTVLSPLCLNDWLQSEGQGIQVLGLDVSTQDSRSVLEILLAFPVKTELKPKDQQPGLAPH